MVAMETSIVLRVVFGQKNQYLLSDFLPNREQVI